MSDDELTQETRNAARQLIGAAEGLMRDWKALCAKLDAAKAEAAKYFSFLYGCDKHRLWQGASCIGCIEEENRRLRAALRAIADYDKQSIWIDDRDDAADNILDLARQALEEQPEKS